ncbi:hypothetical protein Lal_00002695 [Lupinus albus]|uniref:Uncharacterized protein n=1 Tax=Lupinus albus TaxID=3870 RepID=A0A6A4MZN8_LUPAL|nr:hypothetical protein Lalb_Chr22g0352191 [Lupinus albus]KAF1882517.1 hypothetical protein Lal_00002695 [Lupinus albus]
MRLTGTGTGGYMGLEPKQICQTFTLRNQIEFEGDSDLFDEDQSYSDSLHFLGLANGCLAFWLLLVASSYLQLSTNLNFFGTCRSRTSAKVSLTVRTISNARTDNGATALNCHKCDAYYYEISDFDRTSYFDALLSLEDEDTKWLSDSMLYECPSDDPSTPLSYKCNSLSEISYIGSPSYWDSLLNLEEKDSDKEMYFDSLLSLEDDDNGWLSDSFENPSTPLSYKSDSFSEISDIGSPSYWSSLLKLEQKDNEGIISDSKQNLNNVLDDSPNKSEDSVSATTEEFSKYKPLFWLFEEENFASNNDHSIETLLGLKEFDGHEGLDSEFNIGDDFMLD